MAADPTPTDEQRVVACYLFLSPYHSETWPMETIDRLVALRRDQGEETFLREVWSVTYGG